MYAACSVGNDARQPSSGRGNASETAKQPTVARTDTSARPSQQDSGGGRIAGAPKTVEISLSAQQRAAAQARTRPLTLGAKVFRGNYRRSGDTSVFQPCGDERAYDLVGRPEPLGQLRTSLMFTPRYMARTVFAVFRGDFVDDTIRVDRATASRTGTKADSSPPVRVRRRFFLMKFDSLRVRVAGDCRAAGALAR